MSIDDRERQLTERRRQSAAALAAQIRRDAERAQGTKLLALDNAETTHDLREWIKEYML